MAFPAFLDTNVLYSATLNDLLMRLGELEVFRPLWSKDVLRELETALVRNAHVSPEKARRRIGHMQSAFPTSEVHDYEGLVPHLSCDPKDRHILAAAITGQAQVLVTFNIQDFPDHSVTEFNVGVSTPDEFLLDQWDLHPAPVALAVRTMVHDLRRPSLGFNDLATRLERAGIRRFARVIATEINQV